MDSWLRWLRKPPKPLPEPIVAQEEVMPDRDYTAAAKAMNEGVGCKMMYSEIEASPQHLRASINSALVNDTALINLLISKGLITEDEYKAQLTKQMNLLADRYEKELGERSGIAVKLG